MTIVRPYSKLLLLVLTAALWGCSSSVEGNAASNGGDGGGGGGGDTTGPGATCPEGRPAHGAACTGVDAGLSCRYPNVGDGCSSAFDEATCSSGHWSVIFEDPDHCTNPCWPDSCTPQPQCPEEPPVQGTPCNTGSPLVATCPYDVATACGSSGTLTYTCASTWTITEDTRPLCTPTDVCHVSATEQDCAANQGCAWFYPGCSGVPGPNPLPQAGCYPVFNDCHGANPDACQDGEQCVEYGTLCNGDGCSTCDVSSWFCMRAF